MNEEYDSEYQRLLSYVDAACTFADAAAADLKQGKKYSNETVIALSKFITVHNSFNKLVDTIRSKAVVLN